jgi:hypothetical protein
MATNTIPSVPVMDATASVNEIVAALKVAGGVIILKAVSQEILDQVEYIILVYASSKNGFSILLPSSLPPKKRQLSHLQPRGHSSMDCRPIPSGEELLSLILPCLQSSYL